MARNSTALAVVDQTKAAVLEQVVIQGDLSKLQPAERVAYYKTVCESVGLNPFTKPFEYINLNGKLTLYAKRDATDQLRAINGVSVEITSREMHDNGIYVVTARARDKHGRTDEAIGAVSIAGLKGDALANAIMKCETKAKRRVTLSICGLGWLDETEVSTVPDAEAVDVDMETGEIKTPMKNVTPPREEQPVPKRGGDESKRDDYHVELLGYLKSTHNVSEIDYVSFVDYHCQGHPKTCDIDRLAELARYAFAAGKRKSQSAAQRIATLVDEWRKASETDLVPDEVPGDDIQQEALV